MVPCHGEGNSAHRRRDRLTKRSRRLARVWLGGVLAIPLTLAGCVGGGKSGSEAPLRAADVVLREHSDSLFAIPGVRGTGVTDWRDEEVIVVIVESREAASVKRIPERLEGYRVLVLDEEEIRRLGGL